MYAEVFAAEGVLHLLEGFASQHGADFYKLPRNPVDQGGIRLEPTPWEVPAEMAFGDDIVVPLKAGETIHLTATRVPTK